MERWSTEMGRFPTLCALGLQICRTAVNPQCQEKLRQAGMNMLKSIWSHANRTIFQNVLSCPLLLWLSPPSHWLLSFLLAKWWLRMLVFVSRGLGCRIYQKWHNRALIGLSRDVMGMKQEKGQVPRDYVVSKSLSYTTDFSPKVM